MSHNDWRSRVKHMVERIDWILEFIDQQTPESLREDVRTWLAVQMAFVQIGEAASRIPDEVKQANPHIEWTEIRHYRNFLTHVYDAVDPARVLETARVNLPPLRLKLLDAIS